MRTSLALIPGALALAISLAPAAVDAMPLFPSNIQSHLGLSYTPPCTICHVGIAESGTATTPFASVMIQNGLTPLDATSVDGALDAVQALGTDSDCDGVPDVQQLKDGRDPSTGAYIDGSGRPTPANDVGCPVGDGGLPVVQPVVYGCGAHIAPTPVAWEGGLAVIVGLGALLTRRQPQRRRPRGP